MILPVESPSTVSETSDEPSSKLLKVPDAIIPIADKMTIIAIIILRFNN